MTFQSGGSLSGGRVSAGGGRRGMAVGGGVGTLLIALLAIFLGVDPQGIIPATQGGSDSSYTSQAAQELQERIDACEAQGSEAANRDPVCRIVATTISLDAVWSDQLPKQINTQYRRPNTKIFKDAIDTGCGHATAEVGPFYCSADNTAYFDLSFFRTLENSFQGSSAPSAQMYVVAHEYGHHVQNVLGWLTMGRSNATGPQSKSVQLELEADCFAGLWFHWATSNEYDSRKTPMLESLTAQELKAIQQTAQAIGDDHIQEISNLRVDSSKWTHGSSEQRLKAFMLGYEYGSVNRCHATTSRRNI
ncbi:MAG: neutral zinc metallopeptidase [Lawsonella sp.]